MADTENPTTFAARLATFERPHHFSKRRASSAKKKAQSAVSWPHNTPAPEALARAGFYYRPSSASSDSVTCFLCSKALDGWEAGDNPADEHLSHVPDCGWAINICIEQRSHDMDRVEEDPLSDKMMQARRDTFRDAWPHEGRKGWKCKLDNMVKAGWCYDPLPEADDFVKCYYCGLSLDGWEPKDDPWVEHQKRAPDCHFFTLIDESAKFNKQLKKGKGRTSRVLESSRMSTQSNMTTTSEAPPDVDLDDDSAAEDGDTVLTTTSTTAKATRGAKKRAKRAVPKRAVTKRTRAGSVAPESVLESTESLQSEPHDETDVAPDASMAQPPKARGKRQASRVRSQPEDQEEIVVTRPIRTASTAKPTPRERVSEDASQLQQELEAAEESAPPPVPLKNTARATRGKKRTSDGQEKLESSVIPAGQSTGDVLESTQPKPTRKGRATRKVIEDSLVEDTPEEMADVPQPKRGRGRPSKISAECSETTISQGPLRVVGEPLPIEQEPAPKRGRGRPSNTATEASETEVLPVIEALDREPKQARGRPSKQSLNINAEESSQPEAIKAATNAPVQVQEATGKKGRIVSQQQESGARISKPSTAHHEMPVKAQPNPPTRVQSAKPSAEESPTASPQSSDAENHPPSSRPSLASQNRPTPSQSQSHVLRVPLATTPRTSPSKRNIIASLHSAQPWTAVDLETLFLPSPTQRGTREENLNLENVLQHLTNPEKDMSVEEWILWNARGAEERLRGECERMIGAFETEGNRALQSLEGVEVLAV